jgi:hypothetical protein
LAGLIPSVSGVRQARPDKNGGLVPPFLFLYIGFIPGFPAF